VLVKISDKINRTVEYITGFFLFVMVIIIFIQVIFRYLLENSLSWSEEMARYLFIWVTILGVSIGVKRGFLVAITLLVDELKPNVKKWFGMFTNLVILFFSLIMIVYGASLVFNVAAQLSPAMRIPMPFVYTSIPVSGLIILIHIFAFLANRKGERD
jgi:TRAP-type C4-dicarboxylate transport system permease small subunit